jgi:hypothetical protein
MRKPLVRANPEEDSTLTPVGCISRPAVSEEPAAHAALFASTFRHLWPHSSGRGTKAPNARRLVTAPRTPHCYTARAEDVELRPSSPDAGAAQRVDRIHMGDGPCAATCHDHSFRSLPLPTSCGHCWRLSWGCATASAIFAFPTLRALHASGRERAAHALQRCISVTARNNSAIRPVSPNDALRCGASFATTAPLFLVLANRCSRPPINPPSGTCLVHRCHLNPDPVQSSIRGRSSETLIASLDVRR